MYTSYSIYLQDAGCLCSFLSRNCFTPSNIASSTSLNFICLYKPDFLKSYIVPTLSRRCFTTLYVHSTSFPAHTISSIGEYHYIFPFPIYGQLPVLSLTEISHNRYHFPAMPFQPLWKEQN